MSPVDVSIIIAAEMLSAVERVFDRATARAELIRSNRRSVGPRAQWRPASGITGRPNAAAPAMA